jgi:hypothetical protein
MTFAYIPAGLKKLLGVSLYILAFIITPTTAAEKTITLSYKADATSGNTNKRNFTNTTPAEGYCATYPSGCGPEFSLSIPNTTLPAPLKKDEAVVLRAPHQWREVEVIHSDGSTQTLKIKIFGLGGTYRLSDYVGGGGHGTIWQGGEWVNNPGPGCGGSMEGWVGGTWSNFYWFFNTNACMKIPTVSMSSIGFDNAGIVYHLQTPDPMLMSPGNYTGSITYTFGNNGDIQLGNGAPSDPILKLNFDLSVTHFLRVQFPANPHFLTLQPQGGWQQWMMNGENYRPKKLMAHQPFRLWTSSRFKMQLQCQYPVGEDCGLQNDAGDTQVAVKTMVTLPYGFQDAGNRPVSRYLLANNMRSIFYPKNIVHDGRSELNFEVEKTQLDKMIDKGPGRYRGDVTVIWDAEL